MKMTIVAFLVVGLIAAVSASTLTAVLRADLAGRPETGDTPAEEMVTVMVAASDLPPMTMVKANAVVATSVPVSAVPDGAVTSTVQVVGQVLVVEMLEGQAFKTNSFASADSGVHLAAALPQGGRAMSVILSEDTGLQNVLYPGCFVDVIASFRLPGSRGGIAGEIVSMTLLEGIRVLAFGNQSIVSGEAGPGDVVTDVQGKTRNVVTLLVDSRQAEALQMAMNHGELSLALRNPLDTAGGGRGGVLLSDMSDEIAKRIAALTSPALSGMALTPETFLTPPVDADPYGGANPVDGGQLPVTGMPHSGANMMGGASVGPETPQWTVRVHRGRNVEVISFPQLIELLMETTDEPDETDSDTADEPETNESDNTDT